MSSTTPIAVATSATPRADQKESMARSPSVIASAASSISASTTSITRKPSAATNGKRMAATSGGRIAFSAAITTATTSAEPKSLMCAPGTIHAAPSSASADSNHATSRWNARRRGRTTCQAGRSPCVPALAIKRDPDASARALLVAEPRGGGVVVYRLGLLLEPRQLPIQVREQHVGHVVGEAAPHDHAQGGEVFAVLRERVGRHLPAALAQRVRHVEDGEVVDVVLDLEGEDGELVPPREQLERPELLYLTRQPGGYVAPVLLDSPVALETEPQEVVVLRDDLGSRTREVQRERRHVVAEVVDPENQILGQRLAVAPHDPAHAGVDEPELVPRGVDRDDSRQLEVPRELGVDERRDERAGGPVDMNWHVEAGLCLEGVERLADLLDRLVRAVEGRA